MRCAPARLVAPAAVADAFAATTRAAVAIIAELNRQIVQLEATLTTSFEQHPDSDIYHSLPGFGVVLGARALGEFGDDPNRYANTKSRRNYAGTSPLTVASGKKKAVLARHVRNRRLYDALDQAAFCALTQSPGCRAFYDQHRANGDLHHQALRALANRLVRTATVPTSTSRTALRTWQTASADPSNRECVVNPVVPRPSCHR